MNPFSIITALASAVSSFFGYKTKVSQTPEQKEIQQVRKERDDSNQAIDDWIDGKPVAGVRQPIKDIDSDKHKRPSISIDE